MNYRRMSDEGPSRHEPETFDPTETDQGTAEWDVMADEESTDPDDRAAGARRSVAIAADRIQRWFAGLDRRPEFEDDGDSDPMTSLAPAPDQAQEPAPVHRARRFDGGPAFARGAAHVRSLGPDRGRRDAVEAEPEARALPVPEDQGVSRFPVAPLGYNRQAVDEHLAALEREIAELREQTERDAPMSIQEELERIGEQTASILVVAHDKAHETTRLAQEQAERCISDAATNAVAITEEAKRRLRELDEETDSVWRERERLLDDVRTVSASLSSLADEAAERFPADPRQPDASVAR